MKRFLTAAVLAPIVIWLVVVENVTDRRPGTRVSSANPSRSACSRRAGASACTVGTIGTWTRTASAASPRTAVVITAHAGLNAAASAAATAGPAMPATL